MRGKFFAPDDQIFLTKGRNWKYPTKYNGKKLSKWKHALTNLHIWVPIYIKKSNERHWSERQDHQGDHSCNVQHVGSHMFAYDCICSFYCTYAPLGEHFKVCRHLSGAYVCGFWNVCAHMLVVVVYVYFRKEIWTQ